MTPRLPRYRRMLARTALVLGLILATLLPPAGTAAREAARDTPEQAEQAGRENPPRTGLLWRRSSLPAIFPLQIRTAPGRGYHVTLRHETTGHPTLAAYINGGDFFRVLVPPGSYRLHVAHGVQWQDEATLFGPRTRFFVLDRPLLFRTRGIGTRAGHLVDLRALAESRQASAVMPLEICQRYGMDPTDWGLSSPAFQPVPFDPNAPRLRLRFSVRQRLCD